MDYDYADVAKMIDHSLLNPTLSVAALESGIDVALAYDVASVCILPYYLGRCSERLAGSKVAPSTVIGFPHGGNTTAIKVAEAERALADGGRELDVVVNVSQVLSENWDYVAGELQELVGVTHAAGQKIKVIFENCYLTDDHKRRLCEICGEAGADWVKTSTGYGTGGATMDDLRLMRASAPASVEVKAAGGVRDLDTLLEVRRIGVTRAGATRTAEMLDEARRRLGLEPIAVATAVTVGGY